MLGYVIVVVFAVGIVLYLVSSSRRDHPPESNVHSMLYSHGSRDEASEFYYPSIRDSTQPFPLSKREEREKTETFRGKK
ncbi:MAG: hypothetical protein JW779_07245 [Candidatus Thorarchaeota archaeon]|nr:hypothetical protein [Candidatus Thorarchaeota archaeon]